MRITRSQLAERRSKAMEFLRLEGELKGDDKKEAEKNKEAARLPCHG
jgi:hypothetical protein